MLTEEEKALVENYAVVHPGLLVVIITRLSARVEELEREREMWKSCAEELHKSEYPKLLEARVKKLEGALEELLDSCESDSCAMIINNALARQALMKEDKP